MSRIRILASAVAALAFVGALAGCSDDKQEASSTSRAPMSFGTMAPNASRFGLCKAYPIASVKKIVGGDHRFQANPSEPIDEQAGEVVGEACSWERRGPGKDSLLLRVEARDFGANQQLLEDTFKGLRTNTVSATRLDGVGDEAFTSKSKDTSLVQIRRGHYLITASSRATGSLDPIPIPKLVAVAGTSFTTLP